MKKRTLAAWLSLLFGILAIALAIYMMANPVAAFGAAMIFLAVIVILDGIASIAFYARFKNATGIGATLTLISGIITIIVGLLMMFNLFATAVVISILLPIVFIVRCAVRLANLGFVKTALGNGMFWMLLALNILGIILGVIMLLNPAVTITAIPMIFCFYLLVLGVEAIILFFTAPNSLDL